MRYDHNTIKNIFFVTALVALFTLLPENAHANFDWGSFSDYLNNGNSGNSTTAVPEFGLGAAAAAGAVLVGGISVIFGRRKKK